MATKILITIQGGIIQQIASNSDHVEVVIIDFDPDSEESLSFTEATLDHTFDSGHADDLAEELFINLTADEIEEMETYLSGINF